MHGLAVFDIDGTIATKGVVSESVLKGVEHIQSLGFLTTVSTGRGFIRVHDALGSNFDRVVSPESLVILEHGAKIVNRVGEVVKADYFEPNELDHIVDFSRVNSDMIRIEWFTSPDPKEHISVWCKDPNDVASEEKKRGTYAHVFHSNYEELRKRLGEHPISSISAKLQEYVSVENLKLHFTRTEIDIIFQDGNMEFVRNISDKAKALEYLEQHHGISRENMLVAGNAVNDVDMLNMDAGHRILVGDGPNTETILKQLVRPLEVIRVDSPEALGTFLQKM